MGRTYFWNHLTAAFQDLFPQAYESSPYGISNADQVLSYVGFSPGICLWTSAKGQQDLNQLVVNLPPGVTLNGPLYAAISPKGYITGVDSQRHLFLLTPIAAAAGRGPAAVN